MDRVAIKKHAKEQIKGKIFTILALGLIYGLAVGAISAICPPVAAPLAILIAGPVAYAEAKIYLGIVNKSRTPEVEDLLLGFRDNKFLRNVVASLRVSIFTALWSLLFFVPGIIKGIAYSQTFYILAEDDKIDAGAAQKKSMEMMNGHKMDFFILQLSFIPWALLVIVTFGIAAIYVEPYMVAAKAEFYTRLAKK